MLVKMLVLQEKTDSYQSRNGRQVTNQVLVLIDAEAAGRCCTPCEYVLNEDEKKELSGKVTDKTVNVQVSEIFGAAGRIRFRGRVSLVK